MSDHAYTLVSPDGNEHTTSSPAYRTRLLAQGYSEKPAGDAEKDAGKDTATANRETPAPSNQARPQPGQSTLQSQPQPRPQGEGGSH